MITLPASTIRHEPSQSTESNDDAGELQPLFHVSRQKSKPSLSDLEKQVANHFEADRPNQEQRRPEGQVSTDRFGLLQDPTQGQQRDRSSYQSSRDDPRRPSQIDPNRLFDGSARSAEVIMND